MVGPVLLFVGGVLFLNGIWILGRIQDHEIAVINLFVGGLAVTAAVISFVQGEPLTIEFGGYVLLFAFTYLWVAYNRFMKVDGAGLGWYCLFVAITAVPVGITVLEGSDGETWPVWLGINWLSWAVLWFLYFVLLALRRPISIPTGWVTLVQGIYTAWIPGYLIMSGRIDV